MSEKQDIYCKYAYKQCTNLRTYKKCGQLHRLCENHRDKANALQKVYATKRRQEQRLIRSRLKKKVDILQNIQPLPTSDILDSSVMDIITFENDNEYEFHNTPTELSEEEVEYLSHLL